MKKIITVISVFILPVLLFSLSSCNKLSGDTTPSATITPVPTSASNKLKDEGNINLSYTSRIGTAHVKIVSATLDTNTHDIKGPGNNGVPLVIVNYMFTNKDTVPRYFDFAVSTTAYQNGVQLQDGIPPGDHSTDSLDSVKPGASFQVTKAFQLANLTTSNVDIDCAPKMNSDKVIISKTFAIKTSSDNQAKSSATLKTVSNQSSNPQTLQGKGKVGDYKVNIVSASRSGEGNGRDSIAVTYQFTNNSKSPISFWQAINCYAFQNGVELIKGLFYEPHDPTQTNVKPGSTFEFIVVYVLRDNKTNVEVDCSAANSNDKTTVAKTFALR